MTDSTGPPVARIAYVHGRPSSHPNQQLNAQSVGGEFIPVDFMLRWHDRGSSRPYRYFSWLACALAFPHAADFDVFLAGGAHVTLPLMRYLGRLRPSQKLIVHFGDELLYSLRANWVSSRSKSSMLRVIAAYDAIICEGTLQAEIARELLGRRCPPTYVVINGLSNARMAAAANIRPALDGATLLHIGAVASDLRLKYKGLDVMLPAFEIAHKDDPALRFTIVGTAMNDVVRPYFERLSPAARHAVTFQPHAPDLAPFLRQSCLYLHCSNGDAFPTAVIEAMAAGLPAMVSEWTGARDAVRTADARFVTPQEPQAIASAISRYRRSSAAQKLATSNRMREAARAFGEDEMTDRYREVMAQVLIDLGVKRRLIEKSTAIRTRREVLS